LIITSQTESSATIESLADQQVDPKVITPTLHLVASPTVVSPGEVVHLSGNLTFQSSGDLNNDGIINMLDLYTVAQAYGSTPEHPNWNPLADLNGDGIVDMRDLYIVAVRFGQISSGKEIQIQQYVDGVWQTIGTVTTSHPSGAFSFDLQIPADYPTPTTIYLRAYFAGGEY